VVREGSCLQSSARVFCRTVDSGLVTSRILINSLPSMQDGAGVKVSGWVDTVRDQKKVQFVVLHDETGAVQVVNPATRADDDSAQSDPQKLALTETISSLTAGSMVTVEGALAHDDRVKLGGLEIKVSSLSIESLALPEMPIAEDSSADKRMDWRFIDLRRPEARVIFRLQTELEHAMRSWWLERDFIEIHTPKLMASASESRAELFEVPYFETTAYLAQSPQFFKQMAQAAGFGRVFEIAPAFRADPSFTARHATEFTSVDMEVSWIDSHHDVMDQHEQLLNYAISSVADKFSPQVKEALGVNLVTPDSAFPRIGLAEARARVEEDGYPIPRQDGDLDPEAERRLSALMKEETGSDFVFVTDYESTIRPFYHARHDDNPGLTKSYDLLFKGTEIATGAQREHRLKVLESQAREKGMALDGLATYFDFFRYGMPPHGGFGMGLARLVMLLLDQPSIRETTLLFRAPNRLNP